MLYRILIASLVLFTAALTNANTTSYMKSDASTNDFASDDFWNDSIPRWANLKRISAAATSIAGSVELDSALQNTSHLPDQIRDHCKRDLSKRFDKVSVRESGVSSSSSKTTIVRFICSQESKVQLVAFLRIDRRLHGEQTVKVEWEIAPNLQKE